MRIVVDANVFISALLKDSITRRILKLPAFQFYIPDHLLGELDEHIEEISHRSGLNFEEIRALIGGISREMIIVQTADYKHRLEDAKKLIADMDDVPFMALALALGKDVAIWSADKDFTKQKVVKIVSTGDLIRWLKERSFF
ncbi:MAG: PIN domain-containing protein [Candidatus Micrarchaeota archaeon]